MYYCTKFGKAGAAYQAYIAGSNNGDVHDVLFINQKPLTLPTSPGQVSVQG
jgi:hypothetical protein